MVQEYDLGNVRGAQGPPGPAGPQGPAGAVGPTPHITVGNTLSLPAGSAATVSRREGSPDSAPIFDFGIPASGGDMDAATYDPNNRHQDIFTYVDISSGKRPATVVVAAADSKDKQRADYKCSGSGDQLVLKTAINSLPANGGKVVLLDGTYYLDTNSITAEGNDYRLLHIVIPNVTIEGMGSSTVLKLDDGVSSTGNSYYCFWASAAGFRLRNLTIDGNEDNNSSGEVEGVHIPFQGEWSSVSGCMIRNCSYCGINIQADGSSLCDNIISNCGDGLRLEGAVDDIHDNQLTDNSGYAIYANGGSHRIHDNYLCDNGAAGIYCQATSSDLIYNNYLVGQPVGISLTNASYCNIRNNFIRRQLSSDSYGSNEYSLYLNGCSSLFVLGNRIPGKALNTTSCSNITKYFSGTDWNING